MCTPGVPMRESVGFGHKPGVAVVNFQLGFTDARFPSGGAPLVERAVSNSTRLLAVARGSNVPIATCYTGYNSKRDMPIGKSLRLMTWWQVIHLQNRTQEPMTRTTMSRCVSLGLRCFSRRLPRLFSMKNQWIPSLSPGACVRQFLTAPNGNFGPWFQRMAVATKNMTPIMTICGMWGVDIVILQL